MKKLLCIVFLLLFLPTVFAGTIQVITTRSDTSALNTNSTFNAVMGIPNSAWATTLAGKEQVLPARGVFSDFKISLSVPPDPTCAPFEICSTKWTFHVIKNGARTGNAICSLDRKQTSCTSNKKYFFDKQDRIAIEAQPTNSPASAEIMLSVRWTSSRKKETILLGGSSDDSISVPTTNYLPLHGKQNTISNDLNVVETIIPFDGNITDFYTVWDAGPTTSFDYNIGVLKNGVLTGISVIGCAIGSTSIPKFVCKKTGTKVSVQAGDTIAMQWQKPSGAVVAGIGTGLVFIPDEDGNFILAHSMTQRIPNQFTQATRYRYNSSGNGSHNSSEVEANARTHDFTANNIFMKISNLPNENANWTLTQRSNQADTSLACTIISTNSLTCNAQAQLAIVPDANVSQKINLDSIVFLFDNPTMVASIGANLPVPVHHCDYVQGSGDMNILCNNFCTVVEGFDLDGNNLSINDANGSGTIFIEKDINGINTYRQSDGCTIFGREHLKFKS